MTHATTIVDHRQAATEQLADTIDELNGVTESLAQVVGDLVVAGDAEAAATVADRVRRLELIRDDLEELVRRAS